MGLAMSEGPFPKGTAYWKLNEFKLVKGDGEGACHGCHWQREDTCPATPSVGEPANKQCVTHWTKVWVKR